MERIVCSALKVQTSDYELIFKGARHHDCITDAITILSKIIDNYEAIRKSIQSGVQGFVTNTNRFVDRKTAYGIAIAARQVILDILNTDKDYLLSEDLY